MVKTQFIDKGLIKYQEAWDFQKELHKKLLDLKQSGEKVIEQYLLYCEHPHVYTLGKSGHQENMLIQGDFLKKINAEFFKIDRGGDITYHGPGQIVGYPVFDLESMNIGIRSYIGLLENAVIKTLAEYNIQADRLEGAIGVWLKKNHEQSAVKICAIGVKVSRMISMHGFALNVNTDLNYFNYINPCGFIDKGVTSMEKELGEKINISEVKTILLKYIKEEFALAIE
ncbi:MAG: lipoyl(octanoyl) transferase LipB [Bacteroidales bacterium]|nr:lipoyl(octanoyl) transferase LipB [Bacteroidales bacterium]MCF8389266.1 lipoyl(octanoyl) transferase LipB [Bacteroidales bacterium]